MKKKLNKTFETAQEQRVAARLALKENKEYQEIALALNTAADNLARHFVQSGQLTQKDSFEIQTWLLEIENPESLYKASITLAELGTTALHNRSVDQEAFSELFRPFAEQLQKLTTYIMGPPPPAMPGVS